MARSAAPLNRKPFWLQHNFCMNFQILVTPKLSDQKQLILGTKCPKLLKFAQNCLFLHKQTHSARKSAFNESYTLENVFLKPLKIVEPKIERFWAILSPKSAVFGLNR